MYKNIFQKLLILITVILLGVGRVISQTSEFYFYNVGEEADVRYLRNAHGSAFFDFDGDGFEDIFIVHNVSESPLGEQPHVFLKNQGDEIFVNQTSNYGLSGNNTSAQGITAGDYDNDGDVDICIGNGGFLSTCNIGFWMNSNNHFYEVSRSTTLGIYPNGNGGPSRCVVFFDYNNDGFLDLLTLHDTDIKLFKNSPSFHYTQVAMEAGLPSGNFDTSINGIALGDVDNDFDLDIYIPDQYNISYFFINNGDGTFTEESTERGLPNSDDYLGAIFLDYDNDGWLDLFLYRKEHHSLLYRNDQDGTFTEVTPGSGILNQQFYVRGGGLSAVDFNNDGFIDILSIGQEQYWSILYRNNGNGTFTNVLVESNLWKWNNWLWSTPVADYNHDGFMDIFFARNGDYGQPEEYWTTLYQKAGNNYHWLHVRLIGVESNRSAIGARVVVWTDGVPQTRMVLGGDGWKVDSFPVEFGFGSADAVDSLIIYWPSGIVQKEIYPSYMNTRIAIQEMDTTIYYDYDHYNIFGNVKYYRNQLNVSDVEITISGDCAASSYTNASGNYGFEHLMSNFNLLLSPSRAKETNIETGIITAFDAALTARLVTGLDSLTEINSTAADVDENGTVEILDATGIARWVVGLTSVLDAGAGAWKFAPPFIQVENLSAHHYNENFEAVLLGDVSGNWNLQENLTKTEDDQAIKTTYNFDQNAVTISIYSDSSFEFCSADVWLNYDPQIFQLNQISTTALTSDFNLIYHDNSDAGTVKIALFGSAPVCDFGQYLTLTFKLIQGICCESAIKWDLFRVNDSQIFEEDIVLSTGISENVKFVPNKFRFVGSAPNPFNPGTLIHYEIDTPGKVTLSIYNMRGRLVRELVDDYHTTGQFEIEWDGTNSKGIQTPSGVYLCRLTSDKRTDVLRITKTK